MSPHQKAPSTGCLIAHRGRVCQVTQPRVATSSAIGRLSIFKEAQALLEMRKNTHQEAARFLQRLEATIVFNEVIPAYRRLTNKPFFTVHDGLFAPLSAKEYVTSALNSLIATTNIPTLVKTRIHHQPVYSSHYPINDGMKSSGVVETTPNPMV